MNSKKTCSCCDIEKNREEFYVRKDNKDGRNDQCKECYSSKTKVRYHKNKNNADFKKKIKLFSKRTTMNIRLEIIAEYGGKCACSGCEETNPYFLTIDHINNDGNLKRQAGDRCGTTFYRQLKARGFPKDDYQLMCFNCNCSKGFFGICGHNVHSFDVDILCPLESKKVGGL